MNAKNPSITVEPNDVQVATSLAVLAKVQAEAVKPDAVEATSGKEDENYMLESPHPALDLSFMRLKTRKEGGGIDYWTVASDGGYRTSDYAADCEMGRALAEEYLKYLGEHPTNGSRTLLGCIVLDMIAKRPAKGLVIGFMAAVNEYAMSVARIAKDIATVNSGTVANAARCRQVDDAGAPATEIDTLIRDFYANKDAWSAMADEDGDLVADGPEYEQSWASCKKLIRYQCRTEEDVRRKVMAILENGWLEETAEIGFGDEPFHFRDFLKTLIPGPAGLVDPVPDPLLEAIKAYRAGLIEFNRLAAEDDDDVRWSEYGAMTYEPWQEKLDNWTEPARTRESAIEALRAALGEDDGVYGTDAAECMVRAALGYLEGGKRVPGGRASTGQTVATASPTIPEMYEEWLAVRNHNVIGMAEEEADAVYQQYASLQARIIAAAPQMPRDVAIQFLVDTDDTDSDFSKEFERRVRLIAQENCPVQARPSMLVQLIATYAEAKWIWETQWCEDEDKAGDSVEWSAYEDAGDAILNYPCASMDEIRIKAAFVLSDESLTDTLMNCYRTVNGAEEYCLLPFLRSMLSGEVARP
ncbi:hypothetical protein [Shinella fusca]|uniref:Uncharacterized protein n=1 Tax=Shinella fusca TaxID=544480 RepID=A0A7W7YW42_9HYPH|nr:hypothetical protein [Shinella fusca]MBB5043466.1 hypothetical protein [Shinella fusca]